MRRSSLRRVRIIVRPALILAFVLSGTASADVTVSLAGQATRYAGVPNRNFGAVGELSLDRESWQYFGEVMVAAVSLGDGSTGEYFGTMFRGGLGARYIARQFTLERVELQLAFEAVAAIQDIEWKTGEREVRPEFGGGFAWSFVARDKLAFRMALRVFFTPSPTTGETNALSQSDPACSGDCMPASAITPGAMVLMGVAW